MDGRRLASMDLPAPGGPTISMLCEINPLKLSWASALGKSHAARLHLRPLFERPQQWGDSERRQETEALAYADRHGLQVAAEAFRDLGVSAFRGANAAKGRLGASLLLFETARCRKAHIC
jgi:hypothetical protein